MVTRDLVEEKENEVPAKSTGSTQTALRELGVLWVTVELAYAGEERTRRTYIRDQETLPTQTHREMCRGGG